VDHACRGHVHVCQVQERASTCTSWGWWHGVCSATTTQSCLGRERGGDVVSLAGSNSQRQHHACCRHPETTPQSVGRWKKQRDQAPATRVQSQCQFSETAHLPACLRRVEPPAAALERAWRGGCCTMYKSLPLPASWNAMGYVSCTHTHRHANGPTAAGAHKSLHRPLSTPRKMGAAGLGQGRPLALLRNQPHWPRVAVCLSIYATAGQPCEPAAPC
jgi:hypothetical protein